jgi:RNA polymerase sigma factor (sigma-70 family)
MKSCGLFDKAEKARSGLSQEEKAKLIKSADLIAVSVANRFRSKFPHGTSLDDIAQEALLAVVLAADNFDPAGPAKFSTVAFAWVQKILKQKCREAWGEARALHGSEALDCLSKPEANEEDNQGDVQSLVADGAGDKLARINHGIEREHIYLCAIEGLTPDQIADRLVIRRRDEPDELLRKRRVAYARGVRCDIRRAVKVLTKAENTEGGMFE